MRTRNTAKVSKRVRKFIKYKLLLDEGLSSPKNYPVLNSYHNVKHIAHDYRRSGISDERVYAVAIRESRLMVVFNRKDFRLLIKETTPSVISLSPNLTNKETDLKICKALRSLSSSQNQGCLISISKSGIVIKLP